MESPGDSRETNTYFGGSRMKLARVLTVLVPAALSRNRRVQFVIEE